MQEIWVLSCIRRSPWRRKWMDTHSTSLAWAIPWTEEPGRCSPCGVAESDKTQLAHCLKDILPDHSEGLLWSGKGDEPVYIGVLKHKPGNQNIKELLSIEENKTFISFFFLSFLSIGRCKSLGSSHVGQLRPGSVLPHPGRSPQGAPLRSGWEARFSPSWALRPSLSGSGRLWLMSRMPQYPLFANVAGIIFHPPKQIFIKILLPWCVRWSLTASAGDAGRRLGFSPGWEDTVEEEMATHCTIFAWKSLWMGSLTGYSSWGCKKSDITEDTLLLLLLLPARQSGGSEIDYWQNKLFLVLTDVSSTISCCPDQVIQFGSFWEQLGNREYQSDLKF